MPHSSCWQRCDLLSSSLRWISLFWSTFSLAFFCAKTSSSCLRTLACPWPARLSLNVCHSALPATSVFCQWSSTLRWFAWTGLLHWLSSELSSVGSSSLYRPCTFQSCSIECFCCQDWVGNCLFCFLGVHALRLSSWASLYSQWCHLHSFCFTIASSSQLATDPSKSPYELAFQLYCFAVWRISQQSCDVDHQAPLWDEMNHNHCSLSCFLTLTSTTALARLGCEDCSPFTARSLTWTLSRFGHSLPC